MEDHSSSFGGVIVPARRPDVWRVDLDGETVIYDAATGRVHVLNPVAGLLWECFDAPVGVDELVVELTECFRTDPSVLEADVRLLVGRLLAEGLLGEAPITIARSSTSTEPADSDRPQVFVLPSDDCTPCVRSLDGLGWMPTRTFLFGSWYVGVRVASNVADSALATLLARHVVEGVDAPAAYSLDVGRQGGAGVRRLQILYRSTTALVRSRRPSRVVQALLDHLGSIGGPAPPTTSPRLDALAFVQDARVVLAPRSLRPLLDRIEPRLNLLGIRVTDAPTVTLGAGPGTITVVAPAVDLPGDADVILRDLDARAGAMGRELPAVEPGDYAVAGWLAVPHPGDEALSLPTAGRAIRTYLPDVTNAHVVEPGELLRRVTAIAETSPGRGVQRDPGAITRAVLELHRQASG